MPEVHVCSHHDPAHAVAWFDHDCTCGELWSHMDDKHEDRSCYYCGSDIGPDSDAARCHACAQRDGNNPSSPRAMTLEDVARVFDVPEKMLRGWRGK